MAESVCIGCDAATASRSGPAPIWCADCKAVVRRENGRRAAARYHAKMQATSPEFRATKVKRARAWVLANVPPKPPRVLIGAKESAARYDRAHRAERADRQRARVARKAGQHVEDVDRLVVLERDDGMCGICGEDVDPLNFHVDHVHALADGGLHAYFNVQVAHPACNIAKGAR